MGCLRSTDGRLEPGVPGLYTLHLLRPTRWVVRRPRRSAPPRAVISHRTPYGRGWFWSAAIGIAALGWHGVPGSGMGSVRWIYRGRRVVLPPAGLGRGRSAITISG